MILALFPEYLCESMRFHCYRKSSQTITLQTFSMALIPPRTLLRGPKASDASVATSKTIFAPSTSALPIVVVVMGSDFGDIFSVSSNCLLGPLMMVPDSSAESEGLAASTDSIGMSSCELNSEVTVERMTSGGDCAMKEGGGDAEEIIPCSTSA